MLSKNFNTRLQNNIKHQTTDSRVTMNFNFKQDKNRKIYTRHIQTANKTKKNRKS